MTGSIVCSEHIDAMFTRLAQLDDNVILEIVRRYDVDERQQTSVLSAFRSLTSAVPSLDVKSFKAVDRLGIVAARSVVTAYWPYLVIATILRIPVKIKVHPDDIYHIHILKDIFGAARRAANVRSDEDPSVAWETNVDSGAALLSSGYWDDCERLLVFGSDASVAIYHRHFPEQGRVIGFGNQKSVMLVDQANLQSDDRWVTDLLAFGHIGCLAPRIVVAVDSANPEVVARLMLEKLIGLVKPEIGRAIALRSRYHELLVDGTRAWLSPDGMWLITADESGSRGELAGEIGIATWGSIIKSGYKIGALSSPDSDRESTLNYQIPFLPETWRCPWGMAQFPSLLWANGGIDVVSAVSA